MKNKTALITGITGMVGSHLADYLFEKTDWDIHGMCRWRSPLDNVESLIPKVNKGERVFFHYGDLCDAISLHNVIEEVKMHFENMVFDNAKKNYLEFLNIKYLRSFQVLHHFHLLIFVQNFLEEFLDQTRNTAMDHYY